MNKSVFIVPLTGMKCLLPEVWKSLTRTSTVKYLIFIWLMLCTTIVHSTVYPATDQETQRLQIFSSTDEQVMLPLLTDFQQLNPSTTIDYSELNSLPLFNRFLLESQQDHTADILISSAMDLQIKLVNDGYAATHETNNGLEWLPDWAQWRKQAFGFTYEPGVMVYNNRLLPPHKAPQSRFELIELLRSQPDMFRGKVGTYNIARSGFGYLLASQDAQQASTWGRLTENLSQVDVKLYENTSSMIKAVRSGALLLSYNALGSYVFTAAQNHPELSMVLPSDYTLVMSRIAFVPKKARNPAMGHRFLDYLLSERGQRLLATEAALFPIHPNIKGEATYSGLQQVSQDRGPLKLIKLGPALLTYQDHLKKERFLEEWETVLDQ